MDTVSIFQKAIVPSLIIKSRQNFAQQHLPTTVLIDEGLESTEHLKRGKERDGTNDHQARTCSRCICEEWSPRHPLEHTVERMKAYIRPLFLVSQYETAMHCSLDFFYSQGGMYEDHA